MKMKKINKTSKRRKSKGDGKRKHKRYNKKGGYDSDSDSDSDISSLGGEEWDKKDKVDINNFLMYMEVYINGKAHHFYSKNDMISFINHEINQLDVHDLYYKMEFIIDYIKDIPIEQSYADERKEMVLSTLEHIFINIENTRTDSNNVSPFSPNASPVQTGGTNSIKIKLLNDKSTQSSSINEPKIFDNDSKWKRMSKYLRSRVRKRTPRSIPEEDEYDENVNYHRPVKDGVLDRCARGECCGKGCSIMGGTRRKVYRSRKTRKNRKRRR